MRACVIRVLSSLSSSLRSSCRNAAAGFDLLGFGSGSGEPEEVIVGVPDISQPPVPGITRVPARDAAPLRAQPPRCGPVAPPPGVADRSGQPGVFGIRDPDNSSGVFRDQDCLSEFVQPVQVDIG